MKRYFLFLIVLLTAGFQYSQSVIREDGKSSLIPSVQNGKYDKELIELTGTVTHWEQVPNKTTVQYWIRDNWGELLPVMSIGGHPEVNTQYRIKGTVNLSNSQIVMGKIVSMRFIDEHSRTEIVESPQVTSPQPDQLSEATELLNAAESHVRQNSERWYLDNSEAETALLTARNLFYEKNYDGAKSEAKRIMQIQPVYSLIFYLIILAAVILVSLISFLLFIKKSSQKSDGKMVKAKAIQGSQAVGSTVKVTLPPPGTLKVLPGRLEIIRGESQLKEVRFFLTTENPDMEFTFGRNPGKPYSHVQIENPTISRDQARLLICKGQYNLINRADPVTKNATKLNGVDMAFNESTTLHEGDRILMGVVEMVFHQN